MRALKIINAMLAVLLTTLPLFAQLVKDNKAKGAIEEATQQSTQPAMAATATAVDFRSRFRPALEFTLPAGMAVGKVADALGFGFGGTLGVSLLLDRFWIFDRLARSGLTNRVGLSAGAYYFMTKGSSPAQGSALLLPTQLFWRMGYVLKKVTPFVQLGGGASYTMTERQAGGGYSAARASSLDGYFSPGIGASYGISERFSLLAQIHYDFYFETTTGMFLTGRMGVEFVF